MTPRISRARLALYSLAAAAVILGVAVLVGGALAGLSPALLFSVQAAIIVILVRVAAAIVIAVDRSARTRAAAAERRV